MSLKLKNPPPGSRSHDPSKPVGALLYNKQESKALRPKKRQPPKFVKVKLLLKWKQFVPPHLRKPREEGELVLRVKEGTAKEMVAAGVAELVSKRGRPKSI